MKPTIENNVIETLKTCYDPEIPIDLWSLGLIYHIKITENQKHRNSVKIIMSLTTPGCQMGQKMALDIKTKLEQMEEISEASVDITFEPQWTPEMMTEEAREKLGFSKPEKQINTDWE